MVALAYDGGVFMAADTLLSYGSMAKAPNVPRTRIISRNAAIAATGDYADFQQATSDILTDVFEDEMLEDGIVKSPAELYSKLHRTLYEKRCDFEPYQCSFIVIGHDGKKPFLAGVDSIGTKWTDKCIATGYGGHICTPLLRTALEVSQGTLTRDQALAVVHDCMRALFYRECRAVNRYQIAEAANGHVVLHPAVSLDTQWELQGFRFEPTAIIQ